MRDSALFERHLRFESAIKPFLADLQRFVQSMTHDRENTNDILAETFYKAYRNFDALREQSAIKSWLFTIARREFYEVLQKNNRTELLTEVTLGQNWVRPALFVSVAIQQTPLVMP